MKKQLLFGTALTGVASLTAFRYFAGLCVKRNGYKVPKFINHSTDRMMGNDILAAEIRESYRKIKALPFTESEIISRDGLRLKAKCFKPAAPERVILAFHGWRSSPDLDYAPIIPELVAHNCLVIAPYHRAHGKSEGEIITFGAEEKEDCLLWLKKIAAEYPNLPLYLWGISMGATTVMLAAGETDLPPALKGAVCDCGYDNAVEELKYFLRKKIPKGDTKIIELFRKYYLKHYGFDLAAIDTTKALQKSTLPLLFFHGTGDRLVPVEAGIRNFEAANEPKQLILIEKADHTKCFYCERERCFAAVWDFFETYR